MNRFHFEEFQKQIIEKFEHLYDSYYLNFIISNFNGTLIYNNSHIFSGLNEVYSFLIENYKLQLYSQDTLAYYLEKFMENFIETTMYSEVYINTIYYTKLLPVISREKYFSNEKMNNSIRSLNKYFLMIENILSVYPWIAKHNFSGADISFFCLIRVLLKCDLISLNNYVAISLWHERINNNFNIQINL